MRLPLELCGAATDHNKSSIIRASSIEINMSFDLDVFANQMPLNLDLPGILYFEATKRIQAARVGFRLLEDALSKHLIRVRKTEEPLTESDFTDKWVDVIQGVGGLEPACAVVLTNVAIADISLVGAAEAFINTVAADALVGKEADHFDKLNPAGKWLFLPRMMNLDWQPQLGEEPLQSFSKLVARRNRWVHPKGVSVKGIRDLRAFLGRCGVDLPAAQHSIESVQTLIREFSLAWRGSFGPGWLDVESATERPPCFFIGTISAPARLGRPGERDGTNE